jgi:hypothetical protein
VLAKQSEGHTSAAARTKLRDSFLPELDRPSLLEIIRAYLRLNSLPIMVLTYGVCRADPPALLGTS